MNPPHFAPDTLELLAEWGDAPDLEGSVAAHLAECAHCARSLAEHRALFTALADLPRLSPGAGFADAVMARVAVPGAVPAARPAFWRSRRFLAWCGAALGASAVLMGLFLGWVATHPLLSTGDLVQAARSWIGAAAVRLLDGTADALIRSGIARVGWLLVSGAGDLPGIAVAGAAVIGTLLLPGIAVAFARLLRTPNPTDAHYA